MLLDANWLPTLAERTPLPTALSALPNILLVLGLTLPPFGRLRSTLVLPVLVLASLVPPLLYTTGNVGGDFGLASSGFYAVLAGLDRFVLANAEADLIQNGQGEVQGIVNQLWWSTKLSTTMRGPGWNWRVDKTPLSSSRSKAGFVGTRLLRAGGLYLVIDALSTYMQSRPYFRGVLALTQVGTWERVFNQLAAGVVGGAAIALLYDLLCILGVALCVFHVEECPNLFGSLAASSSLRGFWGETW